MAMHVTYQVIQINVSFTPAVKDIECVDQILFTRLFVIECSVFPHHVQKCGKVNHAGPSHIMCANQLFHDGLSDVCDVKQMKVEGELNKKNRRNK